jgi:hypothetical protein|tara:strand:+ start:293 stop:451 length:159 start_codon:yes stop_codon:yes gene_type:complete
MTSKEITEVLDKLNFIMEEFQMVRDFDLELDEESCNKNIQTVEDIIYIINNG